MSTGKKWRTINMAVKKKLKDGKERGNKGRGKDRKEREEKG